MPLIIVVRGFSYVEETVKFTGLIKTVRQFAETIEEETTPKNLVELLFQPSRTRNLNQASSAVVAWIDLATGLKASYQKNKLEEK
jgi:hypothetical protein